MNTHIFIHKNTFFCLLSTSKNYEHKSVTKTENYVNYSIISTNKLPYNKC